MLSTTIRYNAIKFSKQHKFSINFAKAKNIDIDILCTSCWQVTSKKKSLVTILLYT